MRSAYLYIVLYFYALRARPPGRVFLAYRVQEMSKTERHSAIRNLVATIAVTSQDELRRKLIRRGFDVTQATLSRDIHELRLYKGPNGYALPNGNGRDEEDDDQPTLAEVLSGFGLKVKQAQNQLVLITTLGGAQPVAAAMDHEDLPEVVGTIAGDDTVLIICPDQKQAAQLRDRLEEMIG
ncbi:ArgR family transcriptional regulator [Acidipila rosea]|uniref:Arginine repressor n=2 Tax=Acidipila rosea TaxID=768535 RepID=A0A4R1L069_9BACT|nr:ArgR family transcriptional regulator [Acidipila rosea]